MRMADGVEPDGIEYSCYLQPGTEKDMLARVQRLDGTILTEKWRLDYAPLFGFDVGDVQRGEAILDRLINNARK